MGYAAKTHRHSKARSGIALGGIGAGWFELRQDGIFRNWNTFNNKPHGTGQPLDMPEDTMLFFIVRYEVEGDYPQMKILQIGEGYKVGGIANHYYSFPWMTGVDQVEFSATFPFAWLRFTDEDMPLVVELEAFSPFVPHDVKNSSLPAAVFNFRVRSTVEQPVHVMLMASMHSAVGYDVEDKYHVASVQESEGCRLFTATAGGMDEIHSSFGGQTLVSFAPDSTHYIGWEVEHPYYEVVIRNRELPDFDDTAGRNAVDEQSGELRATCQWFGTLAASRILKRRGELDHSFALAWHFPNLYDRGGKLVGHYYSNYFNDVLAVADYVSAKRHELRERSLAFQRDFYESSAPNFILDQVHSQLNTFFTSSWLTQDGNFGIQEGMSPERAYGPLATVDVSTYGAMSTAALFPALLKSMMRAHTRLQAEDGEVGHGINRDFDQTDVHETVKGRLDLPSQYVILTLMGYFWTNDIDYLRELWPGVRAALDYVLRERDMNGDCLPDMEGTMCTYDNFAMFGASSYVSSLWLAALTQAVEAASRIGDAEAEQRYSQVLQAAREAFEQKLWNGSYYRLFNDTDGAHGLDEGCLTDQLIGRWTNHLVGLGDIAPREHVRSALKTICEISRQPWGLVNCRWPDDVFLHPVPETCWHDQANTCWSGVELAFASFLLYEGMRKEAYGVIENVDRRYRRAGMYWDHIEFGGHYYRPMSAWAIVNGLLGLSINAGQYTFDPRLPGDEVKLFFAHGKGTGHYERRLSAAGEEHRILVGTGSFVCRELCLRTIADTWSRVDVKLGGETVEAEAVMADELLDLRFSKPLTVAAGGVLSVAVR